MDGELRHCGFCAFISAGISHVKSGLEVDFVLGDGEVGVEVKRTSRVDPSDLRSLRAFVADHRPRHAILVCNERAPRLVEDIEVLPWREFLARLWGGRALS